MMKTPILAIVTPCYNEEEALPISAPLFTGKVDQLISEGKVADGSHVLFVDDGSRDGTWAFIRKLAARNRNVRGISLSRNRGHQNALLAGLMEAKDSADIVVSIDGDCQDDIDAIDEMIEKYSGGAEVVYGVRNRRDTDTWFKRTTALAFYRLMQFLGADIVYNHADYRLASSRVLDALARFKEVNLFLRGIFPLVGFKSGYVYYDRKERSAGKSHYPFFKMFNFAVDGITSLSVKPIRLIVALGMALIACGLVGIAVLSILCGSSSVGWMAAIGCTLCGVQCMALGVVGEYIGKIYLETKQRPRFVIAERTGESKTEEE